VRLILTHVPISRIDPDAIALLLPERQQYLDACPRMASKLLHPEASLLQEILMDVAKEERRSLVVDGSLSQCGWYAGVMKFVPFPFSSIGLD
jgi:hypothetical protein